MDMNGCVAQSAFGRGLQDGEFCLQNGRGGGEGLKVHHAFENRTALLDFIKACGKQKDLRNGSRIHADVLERGLLKKDIALGNALLSMYAKCGALAKSQEMFNQLSARNVVTWNALITGYIQQGFIEEALNCFGRMQDEGLSPDAVTFICILKACSSIGALQKGEDIHAEVHRQGLLEKDVKIGTALVDMYAKCGALPKAQGVFDKLPARDVVAWNALIAGYSQHGLGDEALSSFEQMRNEGLSPDVITFASILKACGSIRAAEKGEEIHAEVGRQGLLGKDIVLDNALVDMYAKCGALAKARAVVNKLPARDVVTWNALISGYVQHGLGDEALRCFGQMCDEGISPDAVTFMSIFKACGSIGAAQKGEEIHAEVGRQGLLETDNVLGTALVDMYAKCGALVKAQVVFDKLPARNVVTWNALITGYAQHGLADEVLICFGWMQDEGLSPDAVTFACVLKACGSIGAAEKGKEVHAKIGRQGVLEKDISLGNALVDMYAKCGALAKAQEVFDELPARDVTMWTTLIAGYAQMGKVEAVFDSFITMIGEGIVPDEVTFVILLTACSHAGFVEEGQMYYDTMSTAYCIIPVLEHHACMVDLFSRAGLFDKALHTIEKVRPSNRLLLWSVLMGACEKWENLELGRWAFAHAVQLDEKFAAAYVCMINIYGAAGMQAEADEVEDKTGALKIPGTLLVN